MAADKARGISLLHLVGTVGPLPAPLALRVALDVLEPIAAGSVSAPVSARRDGSRHSVTNVQLGQRGKAKLVGRGNRSGVQILLWEILAGRVAPEKSILPLSAVVEDAEPEVAHVVDAAVGGQSDYADAHALLKALVIASAGLVGVHRDVAKLVMRAVPAERAALGADAPVEVRAPISTILPPPKPEEQALPPPPPPPAIEAPSTDADDMAAADLDAVLSEELDRLAPHGWDEWQLEPSPPVPPVAPGPQPGVAKARFAIEDPETLDGDDVILQEEEETAKASEIAPAAEGTRHEPPPLPHGALIHPDVVLLAPDGPTAAHLSGALRRVGYVVEVDATAEAAIARACGTQPRVIVCDDEFLDESGEGVAQQMRTNSPRACLAPFIFLVPRVRDSRLSHARAGLKDVWLEKPFSVDSLLGHVATFAGQPKPKADSSMLPPVGETAMDGNLSLISLRTLFSMLELEKKSGVLHVTSKGREASFTFRDGRATRTRVQGRSMRAADALETLLSWGGGHFTFKPTVDAVADRWASPDLARSH